MTPTVGGLVAALRQSALLEPDQQGEAERLAGQSADVTALARELLHRGWVTLYQLKQLFLGKGVNLVLGQYVVLDLLGEGGMGQVLKARHRGLDRLDALKVIRREHLAQADALRRFQREARAAARLNHPNIVDIYTTDEINGTHFIAMEYVAGVDLAQIVKTVGALNVGPATNYIRQAALGLQHAHEKGLVHRDIKPANLLVTSDGSTVKILDMGLARLHNLEEEEGKSALTQTGVVMGTPDYMAPEQAIDSSAVDIRADIYSLGCTLYYLLCAAPPFPVGSLTQKLLWHQQREPESLESKRPDLPPELLATIRKMMAKDPDARYQTPAEVAAALETFVALDIPAPSGDLGGTTLAPGEFRPGTSTDLSLSLAQRPAPSVDEMDFSFCHSSAGLVASLSVPVGERTPIHEPATVVHQTVTPSSLPTNDHDTAKVKVRKKKRRRRAEEPDEPEEAAGINWYTVVGILGFLIAALALFWPQVVVLFSGGSGGTQGGPPAAAKLLREITLPDPVECGAFLPDGQRVVLASGAKLTLRDANSGAMLRQLEGMKSTARAVACSPKANLIFAGLKQEKQPAVGKSLYRWDLREAPSQVALEHAGSVTSLSVSHDGQLVAVAGGYRGNPNPRDFDIVIFETETGAIRQTLPGHTDTVFCVRFAPDRRRLLSCSFDGTVRLWSLGTEPGAVMKQKIEPRIHVGDFVGERLILGGEENGLGLFDPERKAWVDGQSFPGHTADITCLAVSPDGKRLLSGSGDRTVRLYDLATKQQLALFEGHAAKVWSVCFSPDGKRALSTSEDKSARVWQLP